MSLHSRRALILLFLALALALGALSSWAQPSRHLALGNPSNAVSDPNQPANYLIVRDQYALSYSRDRGIPNWVSWHLQASDLGPVDRYEGRFFTDTSLPQGWYRVTHDDHERPYDRGHMTPSADRTATEADNEATFILTNVLPQHSANNQGLWRLLEDYARDLVAEGNEIYIISSGNGSLGTLADGKLTIPAVVWKVMLVLPAGEGDDAARVTTQTRVIAVWTPNDASVQGRDWEEYQVSAQCVEERTGYDFFAAVSDEVEAVIEGASCVTAGDERLYLPKLSNGATAPTPTATTTASPTPTTTVSPTATATSTPTTTPPAGTTNVEIVSIDYNPPGEDLAGEYVLLRNTGTSAANMTGWTLRDLANNSYTFPAFSLATGAEVRLWTRGGTNDNSNLYWGRTQAVWNNDGDTAILRDAGGSEVDRFSYP